MLDDKVMFDPLSLSDFEAMKGAQEATVHVKVGTFMFMVFFLFRGFICVLECMF